MNYKLMGMAVSLVVLAGCSSIPKKKILDASSDSKPSWTESNKLIWEDGDAVVLRATHTVRGNERANGCVDLAKLDAKENLISEIKNNIKGSIDNAQQSIDESAEIIIGKVRTADFEGSISGLRFEEDFWQKYSTEGQEPKTQCYVLGKIKKEDYLATKRAVVNKIAAVDPRLKAAITKKQIDFFASQKPVEMAQPAASQDDGQ